MAAFQIDPLAAAASSLTIGGWFRTQARLFPDCFALQQGEQQLTYRQLNERVNRLAQWFLSQGLRRNDCIAILSENRLEYIEVELAAAKLGIVTACQNWRQADPEIAQLIATEKLGWLHVNSAMVDRLMRQMQKDGTRVKGMKVVGVMADLIPRHQI